MMKDRKAIDLFNMHGCVVKDERGIPLATLLEDGEKLIVKKTAACSIGDYLSILSYLNDLGFEAK
jgi:hypothetical protein